jgi:hypothetical protein
MATAEAPDDDIAFTLEAGDEIMAFQHGVLSTEKYTEIYQINAGGDVLARNENEYTNSLAQVHKKGTPGYHDLSRFKCKEGTNGMVSSIFLILIFI